MKIPKLFKSGLNTIPSTMGDLASGKFLFFIVMVWVTIFNLFVHVPESSGFMVQNYQCPYLEKMNRHAKF
jgi:hypothetical protein